MTRSTTLHPQPDAPTVAAFDAYAGDYDAALNEGLKFTGEAKEFFAEHRVRWLHRTLDGALPPKARCLDFGCGTGTATPWLREILDAGEIVGVDTSAESCAQAQQQFGRLGQARFGPLEMLDEMPGSFDLVYCNGVFHHIPPMERMAALARVHAALKPGGWFALWENNAWNPITRFLMSRVPFDRDAVLLFPHETRSLLEEAGFDVVNTSYLFIFPSALGMLRPVERAVSRWPLGAQYQVLARRRGGAQSAA